MLNKFVGWARENIDIPNDNRALLTGLTLADRVVGIAAFRTMCSNTYSVNTNMCTAKTSVGECTFHLAHQIGMNLGLGIDGRDNDCNATDYIMGQRPGVQAVKKGFSPCSVKAFNQWISEEHEAKGGCLARLGNGTGDSDRSADVKDHATGLLPSLVVAALGVMTLAA